MSKYFILFFLLIHFKVTFSQKYDYNWVLGSQYHDNGDSCQYGMILNFDKELNIKRSLINRIMNCQNNSFSDSSGNLKYYTNGCCILNANDKIIDNGDSLNLTYDYEGYCTGPDQPYGIPFPNSSLILPLDDGNLMYLSLETIINDNKYPYVFSPNVLATLIDTRLNKVIYKNRSLLSGNLTLTREGLTA